MKNDDRHNMDQSNYCLCRRSDIPDTHRSQKDKIAGVCFVCGRKKIYSIDNLILGRVLL
ncbi:hypothetical protein ACFL6G_09600 [candidate division KSB1 bacterium]